MTRTAPQIAQERPYATPPLPMSRYGQHDAVAPAFAPIIIELGYHGVHVPRGQTYHRQPCPHCSPWRQKSDEPCLVARIISDTEADVICHHCGLSERIAA